MLLGRVGALYRYPVKSLGGEQVDTLGLTAAGPDGDRVWAVRTEDGRLGSGKTSARFRRVDGLLELRAHWAEDGTATIHLPDGTTSVAGDPATDERLSTLLGRPLRLVAGPDRHHDDCPVHLVTTASLRALGRSLTRTLHPVRGDDDRWAAGAVDVRRARPNLLLDVEGDGYVEDGWSGRRLRVGPVVLQVGEGMPRCAMVGAAQPGLPASPQVLRTLGDEHDLTLGMMAEVVTPGTVRVGDEIALV